MRLGTSGTSFAPRQGLQPTAWASLTRVAGIAISVRCDPHKLSVRHSPDIHCVTCKFLAIRPGAGQRNRIRRVTSGCSIDSAHGWPGCYYPNIAAADADVLRISPPPRALRSSSVEIDAKDTAVVGVAEGNVACVAATRECPAREW